MQKSAARFVTGNYNYETAWEYDWHSWAIKVGYSESFKKRGGGGTVDSYYDP